MAREGSVERASKSIIWSADNQLKVIGFALPEGRNLRQPQRRPGSEEDGGSEQGGRSQDSYAANLRIAYAQLYNAIMAYCPEWQPTEESGGETELARVVDSLPPVLGATFDQMLFVAYESGNKNLRLLNRLGVDGCDRANSVRPASADLYNLMVEGMKSPEYGSEVRQIVDRHDYSLVNLPIMDYILDFPRISKEPKLPADSWKYGPEFSRNAMVAYCQFYNSLVAHGPDSFNSPRSRPSYRRQMRALIMNFLPHPQHALVGDILEIGELVRARSLELFYRLGIDGRDMGTSIKSATADLMNLVSGIRDPQLAELASRAVESGRVGARLERGDCNVLQKSISRNIWGDQG